MHIQPLPDVLPPRLSYPCAYCDRTFKFAIHYRRHVQKVGALRTMHHAALQTHLQGGVPKCSMCDKVFKNVKLLNQHSRVHTNQTPFPCRYCGMAFKWGSAKQRHELLHVNQQPHEDQAEAEENDDGEKQTTAAVGDDHVAYE